MNTLSHLALAISSTVLIFLVSDPVQAIPQECNTNSPCLGSTCPTVISAELAQQPTDACPRFGEFQSDVDVFSWNSFIAMNWPANLNKCEPDVEKSILTGSGPTVWETFSEDTNVFVSSGSTPQQWCSQKLKGPKVFKHISKASANLQEQFPDIDEAVGGVLTDQNQRFVRSEKRLNLDEYNYVVSNDLWNQAGQQGKAINFPDGSQSSPSPCGDKPCGKTGSMEIKAAWKVLSQQEIDKGRFYTTQGIVYNDNKETTSPGKNPVTLGLVGMHIIHKTPSQNSWFWSTFEQVDNAPTIKTEGLKQPHSFYNPNCEGPQCKPNVQTASKPYQELNPDGIPINSPVQVIRTTPIESSAPELNRYYQQLLGDSVWANYELIGTQWATGGAPQGTPPFLANTTLETFIQKGSPFGFQSSCLGCHKGAKTTDNQSADFSFLLGEAQ